MKSQDAKNEKAIKALKANPFQEWSHNAYFFTSSTIIKKYKAFMSIRANASELANFYCGSGVDFKESSKARIAEAITSGSYRGMGFMNSTRYGFENLINTFGVR